MKPHIYVGPWGWDVRTMLPHNFAHTMLARDHARKLNETYPWNQRRMEQMLTGLDATIGPWIATIRTRAGAV